MQLRLIIFSLLLILSACSKKTAVVDSMSKTPPSINPATVKKGMIPVDERVVMGTLDNGMKYYIQKNAKPEARAELRLAVNAGSILEDEDQLGLAHFVEHMAFNGTKNFSKNELVDYLESVGTRFGPDLNAYTSFDETVYMLQVRTDSTALFDKGMLILSDWASGITFEHQEIDKERGVVESEWRNRLSADQRMQQVTYPVMYQGSRYAERLPIGDPEIIKNADYSAVKRFYKDWYRPELMAVVVVGDVDPSNVEMQIKKLFSAIPASTNPRERTKYMVEPQPGTMVAVATDKEASFTNVQMMTRLPKAPMKTEDDFRSNLLRSAYNGMLNSRLAEISKEADPPFMFSFSGYSGDIGDVDAYTSFAMVPEGKSATALERIATENKRVLDHGFSQSELDRQKKNMIESAEKNFKEMDKTDSRQLSMRYVFNYLKGNPIPSPKQMLDLYKKHLPGISLSEINALPSQWIKEDGRVVVITGPEKGNRKLPNEDEVNSILSKVSSAETTPYADDVVEGPLLSVNLEKKAILNENLDEETGIHFLELENGAQVYLKPTDFKNDEILMTANSPGGHSVYPDSLYYDAFGAAGIVSESGIGAFTPIQMDKLMAGKSAYVSPYIGGMYEGLNGGASPKDVEDMLKMVYLYFTDVRTDGQAFESYVNKQLGILENLKSNPNFYFSDFASKLKFRNHLRTGFPNPRSFKGINHESAMKIFKEKFSDASNFTFSFVGAFDVAQMKDWVATYIGNLPSTGSEEMWQDMNINTMEGNFKKRLKKGLAPKTQVEMYYHGPIEYTKGNSYHMQSLLAYLRIKLREELREDKGGVYGVRVSGGVSRIPEGKYSITISFNSDPDKTDELIKAAKDVLRSARKDLASEIDMTKVKETQRQSRIKALKENRFWNSSIINIHNEDKDFSSLSLDKYNSKVDDLTPENIMDAANLFFNSNRYIELVMDPKEKPQN